MNTGNNKRPERSLISYFSSKANRSGGINLAQGRPGFSPPKELIKILLENSANRDLHQYAPGNGDGELLSIIPELHSELEQLSKEKILITQGATEAIFLAFYYLSGFIHKERSVLSFDPPYESYSQLASITGRTFEYFSPGDSMNLDKDALENVLKKKNTGIILIASPGNPQGRIWEKDDLEFLIEISEKLDIFIIFDNVYRDIYFKNPSFNPLRSGNGRIFYINSFSKMLSITGWRIGYLIADENHMKKIKNIHDYTGLSANYLNQRSIAQYLRSYNLGKSYTEKIRSECRNNFYFLRKKLNLLNFDVSFADGGYFLWAQIPSGFKDAFIFAEDLFDSVNTAVVPGENFSPNFEKHIRINIATEIWIIEEGYRRIKRFIEKKITE